MGYPKTSGGRGIHVFLRIATDWDFVAVRRAGIALAREVQRSDPDLVTTSWWKEERGQRIFIDYNQNARDRTFAAAYSVRPTPIATVSTPLTWEELAAAATPDDYTMSTVPALVARRGDPMAGLDSCAQSIEPLLALAAADAERGLGDLPYPFDFSRKWVCAGVSNGIASRSRLRSRNALRSCASKAVDRVDDQTSGKLATWLFRCPRRVRSGGGVRSSSMDRKWHSNFAVVQRRAR